MGRINVKIIRLTFASLLLVMTGCVLPGDLYIGMEGGYQDVKISQDVDADNVGDAVFEKGDYIYGGVLGYGLSLVKLYVGAEVGFAYSSFKDDASFEGDQVDAALRARLPQGRIEENFILHAVADGGFYLLSDLLIFGRAGYIYTDNDLSITPSTAQEPIGVSFDDSFSTFAVGGGLEYEIGLGLGLRAVYLRHQGDREADDIRIGVIWRL